MNEEPKSIWKRPLPLPKLFAVWVVLMVVTMLIFAIISVILNNPLIIGGGFGGLMVFGAVVASVLLGLWLFIGWLRRGRNFRRFLFGAACFATLVALFYAEEDWRGWHAWTQFKQAWEARGEHFDLASTLPAPVPDDQNFAMAPIVVSSYGYILTRDGKLIPGDKRDPNFVDRMHLPIAHADDSPAGCAGDRAKGTFIRLEVWQQYYRDQSAKTNEFPVPVQPQSPAKDVLLALSKYDSQVEELRAASLLPGSRFPLNYDSESPWAILLPHLAQLKSSAVMLQLRSAAELEDGQSDKALTDVQLSLQLTDKVRTEPCLISHLVRLAMVQLTLQPIWEGLARHQWSDAQLASLDAGLDKLDFAASWRLGMHGELGGQTGEMDLIRRKPEHISDLSDTWDSNGNTTHYSVPQGIGTYLIPSGWCYQNEYRCARLTVENYLPIANVSDGTFSPGANHQAETALADDIKSGGIFSLYERVMLPGLTNAAVKFAYGQASVNLARTAIALERYRLAKGEYPEALDALAPQFIEQVPHDVIGGKPLKYRREANGQFVLYSVGWNETDDGGTVVYKKNEPDTRWDREMPNARVDLEQGDWVWKYPPK